MTPNQLYATLPLKIDKDLSYLFETGYAHIPELENCRYGYTLNTPNIRVTVHYYNQFYFDQRRSWTLFALKFDDVFVMICQNAGREGTDHVKRFVTNPTVYVDMVKYLASLINVNVDEIGDVFSPNVDIKNLTSFYGNTLNGIFETYKY